MQKELALLLLLLVIVDCNNIIILVFTKLLMNIQNIRFRRQQNHLFKLNKLKIYEQLKYLLHSKPKIQKNYLSLKICIRNFSFHAILKYDRCCVHHIDSL